MTLKEARKARLIIYGKRADWTHKEWVRYVNKINRQFKFAIESDKNYIKAKPKNI